MQALNNLRKVENTSVKTRVNKWGKYLALLIMCIGCFLLIKPSYLVVKSMAAQLLLNHAWHQSLQDGQRYLPWQWSDSYPVAKLTDKNSATSWIVLSGMTGRAMAFAPAWLEDSARPNEYGNTVISAHNDSHFTLLANTQVGDLFLLEGREGGVLSYRVVSVAILDEEDSSPYQFQDHTMLTLITCYPFTITNQHKSKRLVVQAVKI